MTLLDAPIPVTSPTSGTSLGPREAKPVQRKPQAKLLGASKGFAEPHGHDDRQHRRCVVASATVSSSVI
jgi:hypothetical protein